MNTPRILGLTGNIGSGKSTAAALLAQRGAVVVDADRIARDVVAPGSDGLAAVVARFGPDLLDTDGSLNRAALGRIVFADAAKRRDLEAITHPRIRTAMAEAMAAAIAEHPPLVVVEVPLLFETNMETMFPATLLITAPEDLRKQRIMARNGLTPEEADARIAAQMPEAEKRRRATYCVANDGSLDELRERLNALWPKLVGDE